jgi:hypothetical protein
MAPVKKKVGISVVMKFAKSTEGTHVFKSEEDGAPIPTLYVKKAGFPDGPPDSITVTVES